MLRLLRSYCCCVFVAALTLTYRAAAHAFKPRPVVRTLLLDNYDSYTYNLYQLLAEINGVPPKVVYNDAFDCNWEKMLQGVGEFDNIVISPGPGTPLNPRDFGLCSDAIRRSTVPLLGVCLGHQGIAHMHGARVDKAPEPVHGRVSALAHINSDLFRGIPQGAEVVRYHSLLAYGVDECPDLEEVAWTSDEQGRKLLMGLQHKTRPIYGVQFHPESVGTMCGRDILSNFRDITLEKGKVEEDALLSRHHNSPSSPLSPPLRRRQHVRVLTLDFPPPSMVAPAAVSERLFDALFGSSSASFWLDSSFPNNQSSTPLTDAPLLSFMGALDTPEAFAMEYVGDNKLVRRRVERCDLTEKEESRNVFEFLQEHVESGRETEYVLHCDQAQPPPFDFSSSLYGYLGYEARHEAAHILENDHVQSSTHDGTFAGSKFRLEHPTALFLAPTRRVVVDHDNEKVYVVAEADSLQRASDDADDLFSRAAKALSQPFSSEPYASATASVSSSAPPKVMRGGKKWASYRKSIDACLSHIVQGESYEVCLTTQFEGKAPRSNRLALYKTLRKNNPAPYSCFINYDPVEHFSAVVGLEWYRPGGLSVCCSSPERFLKATSEGLIESKPIKGTARRCLEDAQRDSTIKQELAVDEKSRAENLMIVDLVRNDLGRVAEVGSVHVPGLMHVESFKTVHHLVSTVRARLSKPFSIVDAIVATFPGGSMTGAPKRRTMDIIEHIEGRGRGVYSGAIGYLAASGAADLNIAIRTALVSGDKLTVASGGAIIALSETEKELEEVSLKARAVTTALGYQIISEEEEEEQAVYSKGGKAVVSGLRA